MVFKYVNNLKEEWITCQIDLETNTQKILFKLFGSRKLLETIVIWKKKKKDSYLNPYICQCFRIWNFIQVYFPRGKYIWGNIDKSLLQLLITNSKWTSFGLSETFLYLLSILHLFFIYFNVIKMLTFKTQGFCKDCHPSSVWGYIHWRNNICHVYFLFPSNPVWHWWKKYHIFDTFCTQIFTFWIAARWQTQGWPKGRWGFSVQISERREVEMPPVEINWWDQ